MDFNVVIVTMDTETGGLKSDKNPICEIAMCATDTSLKDLREYSSVVAPYDDTKEYTEGALKANGMSMTQIREGQDSKVVLNEIIEFLNSMKRGRNKPILAGHNFVKFDLPFLIEFFNFHGKDFLSYINADFMIDTMWWSRLRWLESANYKLGTCCSNAGVELVDAHRALSDTRSNKDLVKYFIQNLRTEGSTKTQEENRFREEFQF